MKYKIHSFDLIFIEPFIYKMDLQILLEAFKKTLFIFSQARLQNHYNTYKFYNLYKNTLDYKMKC